MNRIGVDRAQINDVQQRPVPLRRTVQDVGCIGQDTRQHVLDGDAQGFSTVVGCGDRIRKLLNRTGNQRMTRLGDPRVAEPDAEVVH